MASLNKSTRPFLGLVSKAKAAKLVRTLVDLFLDMEAGTGEEVTLCQENIQWAKSENRTFLRQELEVKPNEVFWISDNQLNIFRHV